MPAPHPALTLAALRLSAAVYATSSWFAHPASGASLASRCEEALEFPGSAEASVGGGMEGSFIPRFHGSTVRSSVLGAELISREVTFYRYLLLENTFPARTDCERLSLF